MALVVAALHADVIVDPVVLSAPVLVCPLTASLVVGVHPRISIVRAADAVGARVFGARECGRGEHGKEEESHSTRGQLVAAACTVP